MVAEFGCCCNLYSCQGLTPLMEIHLKSIGRALSSTDGFNQTQQLVIISRMLELTSTKTLSIIMGVACCRL